MLVLQTHLFSVPNILVQTGKESGPRRNRQKAKEIPLISHRCLHIKVLCLLKSPISGKLLDGHLTAQFNGKQDGNGGDYSWISFWIFLNRTWLKESDLTWQMEQLKTRNTVF